MKFHALLWRWLQYWHLGFACYLFSSKALSKPSDATTPVNDFSLNHPDNTDERNVLIDEFETLDQDINTVKRLKLMVGMLERIEKQNPKVYERMVTFFEENEKAHRIRRELRTFGKKSKVEALEQKLDTSVRCHPKSGKELIQMFVRGLSELYPDMTKLLLKELEVAMDSKGLKKASPNKNPTIKKVDKKVTSEGFQNTNCIIEETSTAAMTSSTNSQRTMCCPVTCSTTFVPSLTKECENNCSHRFAERLDAKDEAGEEDTGDMRIHPTAKWCKHMDRKHSNTSNPESFFERTKSLNENLTLTAPFKDFQVQGSIMFSNPNKPVKKLASTPSTDQPPQNGTLDGTKDDNAEGYWRGWYPRSDSANVASDVNGFPEDAINPGRLRQTVNHNRRPKNVDNVNLLQMADRSKNSNPPQNQEESWSQPDLNPQILVYPQHYSRTRNKKRSMYVLYE